MKRLKHVDETYFHHLGEAFLISVVAISAGLVCAVHGVFPFLFENTASTMLNWIVKRHAGRSSK